MTVQAILPVKNGDTLGAVRGILKTLLDKNIVDEMLVPLEVPRADQVAPILVKDAAPIDSANPLAPVMRVNTAAVISRVQADGRAARIGAVVRPCELRATIELAKAGRIDLRRLVLIGIDCMGTYEAEAYEQIARASARDESPADEMMRWTRQGPIAPYRLRNACQMCEHFTADHADVAIGLIGMNVRERLLVQARDDIAEQLNLAAGDADGREKAIARLVSIRHHRRDEAMANASQLLTDLPSLVGVVAGCTACGECLDACPYCGCEAFAPKPAKEPHTDRLRGWPGEGRVMRERTVVPFGGLIEWGRRAASCVGCGMCESSCARHVPLTSIQAVLGRKVQEEFHYVPGLKLEDKFPWA